MIDPAVMNFRHLTYFIAVAEELHFGRAAERLHVVQPGVTQQIGRMESELGFALFDRSRRRVQLTDAGRMFLPEARILIARYEQAVVRARAAGEGRAGNIGVGFVGPAAFSILGMVLRPFGQRHPQIELELEELTSGIQLERLRAGTLDAGFVRLPVAPGELDSLPLISEPIVVLLPSDHVLAAEPIVDLARLRDEPFVMVPRAREPSVFDRYMSVCARAGFTPSISQEVPQIHTLIELISIGVGVSLAPQSVARLNRPGVVCRRLQDDGGITTDTGLAWRHDNPSAALGNLIAIARKVGSAIGGDF